MLNTSLLIGLEFKPQQYNK